MNNVVRKYRRKMLSQFIWNVKSRAVVSAVEAEVDSLPRGNWAGNGFTVNSSPVSRIPLVILDSQENILEEAQGFCCRLLWIYPFPTSYQFAKADYSTQRKKTPNSKTGGHTLIKKKIKFSSNIRLIQNGGVVSNI